MDPNITDRGPFYKYRGQLTSFFEATKNFYTNLVKGLEEDQEQWWAGESDAALWH